MNNILEIIITYFFKTKLFSININSIIKIYWIKIANNKFNQPNMSVNNNIFKMYYMYYILQI